MGADPLSAVILGVNVAQQIAQRQANAKAARAEARAHAVEADRARKEAAFQEGEQRRRTRQALGRQRALYAKSGVRLEGTPLLVQEETAALGELDALAIRRAGDARSARALAAAAHARAQRRAALDAGAFGIGRTILTAPVIIDNGFPVLS